MIHTRDVPAATVTDTGFTVSHYAVTVAMVLWRFLVDLCRLPKGVLDEFLGRDFKFSPDGFQPSPQAIEVKRRLYADIRFLRDRVIGMWRPPVVQSRVSAGRNRVTAIRAAVIRATGRQSGQRRRQSGQRRRQRDGGSAKKASSDPDGGDGEPPRLLHPSFSPPRHHDNNRTRVTALIDIEGVTA